MHGGLPAVRVSANFDAHGSADDLVAKADADDTDAVLGENGRCVLHEGLDPGRVLKGVVPLQFPVSKISLRAVTQVLT